MNPNDEKLAQFAEDDVMFHAVKAIVYSFFDANTLGDIPRKEREQVVDAIFEGRNMLDKAFDELRKFRREQSTDTPIINIAV